MDLPIWNSPIWDFILAFLTGDDEEDEDEAKDETDHEHV